MHPVDFVRNWTGVTRTERSAAQEHFRQLCRVLGVPTPADVDKDGSTYTFEKGAAKSTGGQGWADVWYRGHFAWEYQGPNKDLGKAYDQLLRYKDHVENPPLLVVADLDRIVVRTNFTNTAQDEHVIDLGTFTDGENIDMLRRMWTDPMSPRTSSCRGCWPSTASGRRHRRRRGGLHRARQRDELALDRAACPP